MTSSSPSLFPFSLQLDELDKIDRFRDVPENGVFSDLLWSDPCPPELDPSGTVRFLPNTSRGCSVFYGCALSLPSSSISVSVSIYIYIYLSPFFLHSLFSGFFLSIDLPRSHHLFTASSSISTTTATFSFLFSLSLYLSIYLSLLSEQVLSASSFATTAWWRLCVGTSAKTRASRCTSRVRGRTRSPP